MVGLFMRLRRRTLFGRKNFGNTISLLHFNQLKNNNIIDECRNNWILEKKSETASAPVLSNVSRFGDNSLSFFPEYRLVLNTGIRPQDFTMEGFVRIDNNASQSYGESSNWHGIFGVCSRNLQEGIWSHAFGLLTRELNSSLTLYFNVDGYFTISRGTWNHIAITYKKDTNTICTYVNGSIKNVNASVDDRNSWWQPTDNEIIIVLGVRNYYTYVKLDEFRFSKGILYTGTSFTPPSEPFTV